MIILENFQKHIVNAAKEFAKGEFDPKTALDYDKDVVFPKDILKKAGELGFIGLHFPEEYQGSGLSYFEEVLLAATWAEIDSTFGIALIYPMICAEPILIFGDNEQKQELLPRVIQGKDIICHSLDSIFDLTLRKDFFGLNINLIKENKFILTGRLSHVMNGSVAKWLIFGIHGKQINRDKEFCIFIVPLDMEGIEIFHVSKGLGWSMVPRADIVFNNVELCEGHFLGKGFFKIKELTRFWASEMLIIAAFSIGIAQGALNKVFDYVKMREQFGKKLIEFPVTREKLAEMMMKLLQSRTVTYNVAQELVDLTKHFSWRKMDNIVSHISMAKILSSRAAKEICDEGIQLLGGYGYMREYHIERFYRDAKCCELLGGNVYSNRELIIKNMK